ncbi:hypothetical protein AW878_02865 [Bordetella pseudohinzii]|nr:hypothetical protein BBN53_12250 [Bordetella pseudohinzii]KXA81902.1 hypothetical protein AW877_03245 [Bordetella pseudohinzii]KXA82203.1 hypothetical protein AW878_02865 [Bordetella pseudohinzii]
MAAACVIASCVSVGRPSVTQLAISDPPVFMTSHALRFSADAVNSMSVPAGFLTDLASIPKMLWWWQSPHEDTLAPAILHDYLYWEQPCSRDEADAVMYVSMIQVGMKKSTADRIYQGIRTGFAVAAWDNNRQARAGGEPRFFSAAYTEQLMDGNIEAQATLAKIQANAVQAKGTVVADTPVDSIRTVCAAAAKKFTQLRKG